MTTVTENFYKDLPSVAIDTGLCDFDYHYTVPDDWSVVIVDIIGSTKAVMEGRYKDVNIAASCAIIAVLNRVGRDRVAYIYGGDGATFLIPSAMAFNVASAVHGARELSRDSFKLDMRAGMVSVAELRKHNAPVRLAKIETKPGVFQAALSGTGISVAEKLVKDHSLQEKYHISFMFKEADLAVTPASFEGFECRWEPLKTRNGVSLSLIILAQGDDAANSQTLYRDILGNINRICGSNDVWQPASVGQLHAAWNPFSLQGELKARTVGKGVRDKLAYWWHITLMSWVGIACMTFRWKAGSFDGRTYREETTKNSDFIKFDNALRLVMDIPLAQKVQLEQYLDGLYQQGKIFYGTHAAQSALMTCHVHDYNNDHFHFIDGADGGYSLAAKQMKAQIAMALGSV